MGRVKNILDKPRGKSQKFESLDHTAHGRLITAKPIVSHSIG
jgi:hypothetical protein